MRQKARNQLLIGALTLSLSISSVFPLKPTLAEALNSHSVSVESSNPTSNYRLVVSTENHGSEINNPICLIGFPISLKIVNSDVKNLRNQKVSVTDPEGKKSVIYVGTDPIDFLPTKLGQYTFDYNYSSFVVFVSSKEENGTLKLNTNICRAGETIWVDVVNAKGNQIKGGIVKVILPDQSTSEVYISNELNGFIPETSGHYTFVYGSKPQTVCVKPAKENGSIATITLEELDKFSSSLLYLSTEPSDISIIELGISAFYGFCVKDSIFKCESFLSRKVPELSGNVSLIKDMERKKTFFVIKHEDSVLVIGLRPAIKLAEELKLHGPSSELNTKVIVKAYDGKDISFLLIPLNKNRQPRDGGLMIEVEFNLATHTGSVKGYAVIHDTSVCPLSTSPKK